MDQEVELVFVERLSFDKCDPQKRRSRIDGQKDYPDTEPSR